MVTLFMPMAPNPVMGGHVVHVPTSRVYDIDMTVEEGLRSIVTSGVATGDAEEAAVLSSGPSGGESTDGPRGYHPASETPSHIESDRDGQN
jgi:uncharacterized membrane protein